MKLALTAKISCDPGHVLKSQWVHDTTHVLADTILKARRAAATRQKIKKP